MILGLQFGHTVSLKEAFHWVGQVWGGIVLLIRIMLWDAIDFCSYMYIVLIICILSWLRG